MNPHKIENHGEFIHCQNLECIWGATWSMGHICDHCHLKQCTCPCPLTKEWLEQNKEVLSFRRIKEYLASEKASKLWWMKHQKEKGERLAGKFHHQDLGMLQLIEDLYRISPELKYEEKKVD